MFDDFAGLRQYKAAAELLAAKSDWGALYDTEVGVLGGGCWGGVGRGARGLAVCGHCKGGALCFRMPCGGAISLDSCRPR